MKRWAGLFQVVLCAVGGAGVLIQGQAEAQIPAVAPVMATNGLTLAVAVTQGKEMPVGGLKAEDFTVLDNGVPQNVTSFQAVDASSPKPADQVILVFDVLNPHVEDMVPSQYGVESYLKKDGGHLKVPIALAYFAFEGVSIAPPSTDGNALAAAVAKLTPDIRATQRRSGTEGRTDDSYRSIAAMEQIATYAARKPGRKLLIWVGPGWSTSSYVGTYLGPEQRRTLFQQLVEARRLLQAGNITLEQVLMPGSATGGGNAFLYEDYLKGPRTPDKMDPYDVSLSVLATLTGGQVILRDASLQDEIERCVRDIQSYYIITYTRPVATKADEYHEIVVKTDRPGVKVRTLRTYYSQP